MIFLLGCILIFSVVFYLQERGFRSERESWAQERSKLLDRIQRPEAQGFPEFEMGKQYASIEDDEELWEAQEALRDA